MLDFFNVLRTGGDERQQAYSGGFNAGAGSGTWRKPRGTRFIHIYGVGAGGIGGAGATGAGGASAGGGGGGSGAQVNAVYPAHLLPDVLYIWCGAASGLAMVLVQPSNAANLYRLIHVGSGIDGGAAAGNVGGVSGAGGGGGIANFPLGGLGNYQYLAGQASVAGAIAASPNGTSVILPTTGLLLTAGAPGAATIASGTGGNGGAIHDGTGDFPLVAGGIGGSVGTPAGESGSGKVLPNPDLPYGYGGCGGGASHSGSGAGGQGGSGWYGCGGGGGGGGVTAGGAGGRGGQALIIVTAW